MVDADWELQATSQSKVNLILSIRGILPDGRHELDTLFQAIDYGDRVKIRRDSEIVLECSPEGLCPMRDNLAWRAADLLRNEAGLQTGARVRLEKLVPHGAGLGGGSGDAALVLLMCNKLWGLEWSVEQLQGLGAGLGADVPFLVASGAAWAGGAGDVLTPAAPLDPRIEILVATPPVGVNTGWAYRAWDDANLPLPNGRHLTNFPRLRPSGSILHLEELRGKLHNDFEDVVFQAHPEIGELRREMDQAGAAASLLSGSGSSVFGLFEGRTAPGTILREWERRNIRWRWCRPAVGTPSF